MGLLASLRRRLRVRLVHGTSVGFRPGDRLIINVPGYMAEEGVRALWEALKSNFPDTPFQLIVGRDSFVTVVQECGCSCACNAAKDSNGQGRAKDPGDGGSEPLVSSPETHGQHAVPAMLAWSVDVPPQPLGKSFVPGAHLDASRVKFGSAKEAEHG